MVEIGGRPILWHILKHYAHHGFKEFLIALGYKGEVVKRYFLDYCGDLRQHHRPSRDRARASTTNRSRRTGRVHSLTRDCTLSPAAG